MRMLRTNCGTRHSSRRARKGLFRRVKPVLAHEAFPRHLLTPSVRATTLQAFYVDAVSTDTRVGLDAKNACPVLRAHKQSSSTVGATRPATTTRRMCVLGHEEGTRGGHGCVGRGSKRLVVRRTSPLVQKSAMRAALRGRTRPQARSISPQCPLPTLPHTHIREGRCRHRNTALKSERGARFASRTTTKRACPPHAAPMHLRSPRAVGPPPDRRGARPMPPNQFLAAMPWPFIPLRVTT